MFRRTKPEEPTTPSPQKPGGKGRPTPSRREAEAAARARAKGAVDKKAAARQQRERRMESSTRMREAMKSGDERYLPARDQGKVRRFIRDRVDSRLSAAEFLLPLLIAIMVLTYSGNPALNRFGQSLWLMTILLVTVDTLLLVFRLKRDLRKRFPGESHKGAAFYGILRAMQLRFLRLPKPQVKLGQRLPDRY
ncbi:MAG TPA: DUF3043 domain-containing protein [Nocardioidaceae bacterium]|nr:DUF3043 domain-containing protein [Nocardioidaceae bacterium]